MKLGQEKRARDIQFYVMVFVCAVLVGVYITGILMTRNRYEEIKIVQQDLLFQIQLERRVRDTAGVLAELADERIGAHDYFKTPDAVIGIIEELEGFGGVVGAQVTVLQVQVEGENPETREGVFVVNVLSEGSWKQMSQLLGMLDTLPYQASVSQATLDTSGTDVDTPIPLWSLRATLRIQLKK